jgi:hypothetical protein
MIPDPRFLNQPRSFWAHVRTIGQAVGYAVRGEQQIKVPSFDEIAAAFSSLGLKHDHLVDQTGAPTALGQTLRGYFEYRAERLNQYVEPRLMDAARAREVFEDYRGRLNPRCALPLNKQKGEKKAPAYFTGLVNMIVEAGIGDLTCNYDPRQLTTVTLNGVPLRTLARRVDGAFPDTVNPIAVWEIKEYYYTTTFGSRVADGVYETLLDGMELMELKEHEGIEVRHYLMVDSHYTWWECGKSYLCRIMDMLHMGYVDEVLFGYEVVERLPEIVRDWRELAERQQQDV